MSQKIEQDKVDAAFVQYASNPDGSMTDHDLDCAVRRLTGSRLPLSVRSKVSEIIETKGAIGRKEFNDIVEEVLEIEPAVELEDLWEELTGDPNGSIKKHTLTEWVYSTMGFSPKSVELAELLWETLNKEGVGIISLKEVKELLQK